MVTMPFGKWKGYELDEIPEDYLEWCLDQDWLQSYLRVAINDVMGYSNPPPRSPPPRSPPPPPPPPAPPRIEYVKIPSIAQSDADKMLAIMKKWLRLSAKYAHPDRGGNDGDMREINSFHDGLKTVIESYLS